jgi:hypothetical protein
MKTASRPWWKKRRVLWPLVTFFLLTATLVVALIRAGSSQIIIYNDTGEPLGPLIVRACGQEATFPPIADETSVRLRLRNRGSESGVSLALPSNPDWRWEGGYVEPSGGYLVFIHIRRGLEVEIDTQLSFWQQLLPRRRPKAV